MFQDVLYLRVDEDIKAFYMRLNEAGLEYPEVVYPASHMGGNVSNIQVFEALQHLQLSWFGKGQQDCCGHGCASTSHWRGREMKKTPSLTGSHWMCNFFQVIGGSQREERLEMGIRGFRVRKHICHFFFKDRCLSFKRCWLEVGCP